MLSHRKSGSAFCFSKIKELGASSRKLEAGGGVVITIPYKGRSLSISCVGNARSISLGVNAILEK
jgi:hypothetical protein